MRRLAFLALLALSSAGCAGASQPWVELAGHRYSVELAVGKRNFARVRLIAGA